MLHNPHSASTLTVHQFHDVGIWHAAACSPAGDASATLAAITAQRHALSQDPTWGWMGRCQTAGGLFELACAAADPCWQAASARHPLVAANADPQHWPGIVFSVSKGDTGAWLDQRAQDHAQRAAQWIRGGIPGMLPAALARHWGQRFFQGAPPVGACASGLLAVIEAARLVDHGQCPWAIAGAADRSLQPLLLAGFRSLGVCCGTRLPQVMNGPATGFAPAEGAGSVSLGPWQAGDWRLLAGVTLGDASHETRCDDLAALTRLLEGLWQHCPKPEIIVCHGTGTAAGDAIEAAALNAGPWRSAQRLCAKPIIGHSLGANAAVELASALQGPWRSLWKIALGFGGHLAAIAAQRP